MQFRHSIIWVARNQFWATRGEFKERIIQSAPIDVAEMNQMAFDFIEAWPFPYVSASGTSHDFGSYGQRQKCQKFSMRVVMSPT